VFTTAITGCCFEPDKSSPDRRLKSYVTFHNTLTCYVRKLLASHPIPSCLCLHVQYVCNFSAHSLRPFHATMTGSVCEGIVYCERWKLLCMPPPYFETDSVLRAYCFVSSRSHLPEWYPSFTSPVKGGDPTQHIAFLQINSVSWCLQSIACLLGISTVTLQRLPVNSLNLELLQELCTIFDALEKDKSQGMILTSVREHPH
jgi:hypothetical protein